MKQVKIKINGRVYRPYILNNHEFIISDKLYKLLVEHIGKKRHGFSLHKKTIAGRKFNIIRNFVFSSPYFVE